MPSSRDRRIEKAYINQRVKGKGYLSLYLSKSRDLKTCDAVELWLHAILFSALDEGE
jgi:hypothetical protein